MLEHEHSSLNSWSLRKVQSSVMVVRCENETFVLCETWVCGLPLLFLTKKQWKTKVTVFVWFRKNFTVSCARVCVGVCCLISYRERWEEQHYPLQHHPPPLSLRHSLNVQPRRKGVHHPLRSHQSPLARLPQRCRRSTLQLSLQNRRQQSPTITTTTKSRLSRRKRKSPWNWNPQLSHVPQVRNSCHLSHNNSHRKPLHSHLSYSHLVPQQQPVQPGSSSRTPHRVVQILRGIIAMQSPPVTLATPQQR